MTCPEIRGLQKLIGVESRELFLFFVIYISKLKFYVGMGTTFYSSSDSPIVKEYKVFRLNFLVMTLSTELKDIISSISQDL